MQYEHEVVEFVKYHPVAILGTVDTHGHAHGAAVYVYASSAKSLYFVTKSDTQKFKNILANPHVSITIADPLKNSCLQMQGAAHVVNDGKTIEMILEHMSHIYARSADWLPPIAKIRAGAYQVVHVNTTWARLANFKGAPAGSPHIFKEVI